jgi:hypothetical protein
MGDGYHICMFRTFRGGLKIIDSRCHGALEPRDLHNDQHAISIKVRLVYG